MESAQNLFQDPGRQSTALAKVIVLFARRKNADENQIKRLADVAKDIGATGAPAETSAPAAGGGDVEVVDL
eukprot:1761487-Alexandrium_andersonii.AAC.1